MGVDAAHGGRPADEGAEFADQRAASLRRMFPHRQPPVIAVPPVATPQPVRPEPSPEVPARRRRRWWIPVVAGVTLGLVAAGSVVAFRVVQARTGAGPAVAGQLPEGFPVVVAPSFEATPSAAVPVVASPPPSEPAPEEPSGAGVVSRSAGPLPVHTGATKATTTRKGPITAYSACSTSTAVTFAATFTETFSWHHVFVDSDGDKKTGYQIPEVAGGLGAEYMIEDGFLYESTGTDWAWREIDGVSPLLSRSGGEFRWQVLPSYGGVRVTFNGSQGEKDVFTPAVRVKPC
ncbi:hypothetical protein [Actinoplanes sp. GCM10030250]|uniref:hypothetical protein n=1 Tax=Actinoplanes sp. GCM10030250 TaxID=3273376 RepID=UPI003610F674